MDSKTRMNRTPLRQQVEFERRPPWLPGFAHGEQQAPDTAYETAAPHRCDPKRHRRAYSSCRARALASPHQQRVPRRWALSSSQAIAAIETICPSGGCTGENTNEICIFSFGRDGTRRIAVLITTSGVDTSRHHTGQHRARERAPVRRGINSGPCGLEVGLAQQIQALVCPIRLARASGRLIPPAAF